MLKKRLNHVKNQPKGGKRNIKKRNSKKLTNRLNSKLERLAPVFIFAGSNENEALAKATLTALEEEGDYMDWPISIDTPSLANVQT